MALALAGAGRACPLSCGQVHQFNEDTVGATHASPAPVVLGCSDVGRCQLRAGVKKPLLRRLQPPSLWKHL